MVQSVYRVSEPTSRRLSAGGEACYTCSKPTSRGLTAGGSYFLRFPNLLLGDYRPGV